MTQFCQQKIFASATLEKKTITNKQTRLVKLILIGQKIRENYQNILINFKYFENYLDNTGSQTLSGTHLEGFFMITVYRHVHPEIPKKINLESTNTVNVTLIIQNGYSICVYRFAHPEIPKYVQILN